MTHHRRTFLKQLTGCGAALLLPALHAKTAPNWRKQIGLELYTVRDLLATDFEGTLAKVAAIGYREVEPVGYNNLDPKQFRAL
ncbi:MAG: sugar phosphate isomerase/epimerase, partial [Acidobacteria bacterium]|nr:sugar phosphate isomerase/epimerase [Acidobacteriota bacterium]